MEQKPACTLNSVAVQPARGTVARQNLSLQACMAQATLGVCCVASCGIALVSQHPAQHTPFWMHLVPRGVVLNSYHVFSCQSSLAATLCC